MILANEKIDKFQIFFNNIPKESHKFYKNDFPMEKELNPIQKTLVLGWYSSYVEVVSKTFKDMTKKFKLKK